MADLHDDDMFDGDGREATSPNRPSDIALPEGWTWDRVEAHRAKWGIADNMVPLAGVPGVCVAWGTINSVRTEQMNAHVAEPFRSLLNDFYAVPRGVR